nr:EI24 domain-containing protein [Thiolinea sp.]
MTGLIRGFSYVFRGLGLLTRKGIRGFVAIPLLINILLFAGGIWLAEQQADYWMQHLLPDWLSWLRYILWPLFVVVIFFAVFYGFSLLANLIAAPFNAMLSERIEKHLKGQPLPAFGGLATLPGIAARTFRSELGKLWYMGKWLLLIL